MASLYPGTGWCPATLTLHFGQWEGSICPNRAKIKKAPESSRSPATFMKISLGQPNRGRGHRGEAQPTPSQASQLK